ncbi:golvesin C-terminal-like domain-containing protein [Streptomyces antimycoticus]|uniref:golvesin C-terminal-like domain-containing protein n=1 Tax=Streptomyces antimycoticus TaxID=68175 RepID=UPI0036CDE1DF
MTAALAMGASLLQTQTAWAREGESGVKAPSEPPRAVSEKNDPASVLPEDRTRILGNGWQKSADRAWTTSGDADGFHILTAEKKDGYAWHSAATLSEPGFEADAWIGNVCVTGSGKRAVVVYAPRTFTNKPQLMARGAFAAVVDLTSGKVDKLPLKVSLSYYNPGCGVGESAILTQSGSEDLPGTRLIRLNTITGRLDKAITSKGQLTSAIPVAGRRIVASTGAAIARIEANGHRTPLVRTDGVPYRLTPDGEDGVVFLDKRGQTSKVKRIDAKAVRIPTAATTRATVLAEGKATEVGLTRSADIAYITGHTTASRSISTLPSVVRRLTDAPKDATVSTRGAAAVTGTEWGDGKGTMLLPGEATKARKLKLHLSLTDTRRTTSFGVDPGRRVSKYRAQGSAQSPGLTTRSTNSKSTRTVASSSPTAPVEDERTCSVPRNDPRNQAMQPKPRQVEWAVNQAITGYLNTHVHRAANWKNLGMPEYYPQSLFLNPAVEGGGRAMAQVMLGVTTQESNMWQAGREAVPGVTANPLIGNYYGIDLYDGDTSNDWEVNFAKADCGYGITQVTDHMRMAGREDGHGGAAWDYQKQRAAALDYTANVAAGLQILVSKWNETRKAGLIANHGTTGRPENWYFALWAYNSGFHPDAGDGSPWGLGWANNPANPEWDAGRLPFMENAAGGEDASAAARPQNWPYQEKVLGFAAHPPSFLESPGVMVPAFRPATWNGTSSGVGTKGSALYNRAHLKAPEDAFCEPTNDCYPGRISDGASNDNGSSGPCGREDFKCWWHKPVTWKSDCADTCGYEFIRFDSSYSEQADGTAYPPVCTTSGLPDNALIVDDVPESTPVMRPGCSNSAWANAGTFSFSFGNNGTESVYPSKVDLHQLGAGFGGHFWFGHTRMADAKGMRLKIEGKWRLKDPISGQAKVMVHLPDHGAQTRRATYEIATALGTEYRTIAQPGTGNRWVSLGAFRFRNTPEVRLNTIASDGTGDEDIAFDAVAFVPGDYDGIPDIAFPDAVADAPDPEIPDQPETIPGSIFPNPLSKAAASASKNVDGMRCRRVEGEDYDELCIGLSKAKGQSARTASVSPEENATCSLSALKVISFTRFESCMTDELTIGAVKDGQIVGKAYLDYRHQIDVAVNTKTITQTVSLKPNKVDEYMADKLYSANLQYYCSPDCTSALPSWNGLPEWTSGADRHTATATTKIDWCKDSGSSINYLHWTASGTINGKPTESFDYDAPKKLRIRCDNIFSGRRAGCVFLDFTPSYPVNTKANPAAAALYWVLMQKLATHPGSKTHNSPLHRLEDSDKQKDNRDMMCQLAVAKFEKHPSTPEASCDEYAFAASRESGGQQPGVTSGSQCAQMYAMKEGTSWKLYLDDRYPLPTWQEVCGRGNIPLGQNTSAGGSLGRWTGKVRLFDNDAYYVATPGFESCNTESYCQVRP